MAPKKPGRKTNVAPGNPEQAYEEITNLIADKWAGLELEDRIDLALNLVSSLTTQVVRISMTAGIQAGLDEFPMVMGELGRAVGSAVRDGYVQGSDGVCPCGSPDCGPIDVEVSIRPVLDAPEAPPMDGNGRKPGSMVN